MVTSHKRKKGVSKTLEVIGRGNLKMKWENFDTRKGKRGKERGNASLVGDRDLAPAKKKKGNKKTETTSTTFSAERKSNSKGEGGLKEGKERGKEGRIFRLYIVIAKRRNENSPYFPAMS